MNNCHSDDAVTNAARLADLLGERGGGALGRAGGLRGCWSEGSGRGRILHQGVGMQSWGSWIEWGGSGRVVDTPPLAVIRSRACGSGWPGFSQPQ